MDIYKIRLKKGDLVIVRAGKDKGKTGKVLNTYPKTNKVTVEGINLAKRHTKPNREHPQGGIVELTRPILVSKVGIYDKELKKASRISYRSVTGGEKKRYYQASGKEIK
ncbi:MAG TPA: 50S ribosomal protein L24 [Candidatus Saccharimonadales bacterium]|nr:50S ribosomal protein L24 [Candidatus Saccharimonadales bacterium]